MTPLPSVSLVAAAAIAGLSLSAAPAEARPLGAQTCAGFAYKANALAGVATKRGKKRALKRAARRWERTVAKRLGRDWASLRHAQGVRRLCLSNGDCSVVATPCKDEYDKTVAY